MAEMQLKLMGFFILISCETMPHRHLACIYGIHVDMMMLQRGKRAINERQHYRRLYLQKK